MRKVASILCVLLLAACVQQFKYDNVSYSSSAAALAAAKADMDHKAGRTDKVQKPIGGSVLVAVPTFDIIRERGVVRTGNPAQEQVDYVARIMEYGFLTVPEAVRTGQVFSSMEITRAADTASVPFDKYDYKLWLLSTPDRKWQWYLSKGTRQEPITIDQGLSKIEFGNNFNRGLLKAHTFLVQEPAK